MQFHSQKPRTLVLKLLKTHTVMSLVMQEGIESMGGIYMNGICVELKVDTCTQEGDKRAI